MDTIPDVLAHAATTWPDAMAVVGDESTTWTFAELATHVRDSARLLASNGVEPGTRVAVRGTNTPQWIVANLAVLSTGAAVVPLNPRARDAETAQLLDRARCMMTLDEAVLPVSGSADVIQASKPEPRIMRYELSD